MRRDAARSFRFGLGGNLSAYIIPQIEKGCMPRTLVRTISSFHQLLLFRHDRSSRLICTRSIFGPFILVTVILRLPCRNCSPSLGM